MIPDLLALYLKHDHDFIALLNCLILVVTSCLVLKCLINHYLYYHGSIYMASSTLYSLLCDVVFWFFNGYQCNVWALLVTRMCEILPPCFVRYTLILLLISALMYDLCDFLKSVKSTHCDLYRSYFRYRQ